MKKEELIKDLRQFGLSEYEAKAYMTLAIHGPLPASHVSNFSKIPQSKIYEVLKSLVSKMLAEYWNGRPIRYRAIQPNLALKNLINKREDNINSLKVLSNSLVDKLKPMEQTSYEIWTSNGKHAFLEKASQMILEAKKFGYSTTENFSRYPLMDDAFLKSMKRGVKIRILGTCEMDVSKIAGAEWYTRKGAKIKILPMNTKPSLGLIDGKKVCVRVGESSNPDFFWSNNPALVNVFEIYFKELWNRANTFKI